MTEQDRHEESRDAWGPRDWCASGDGGEQFDLLPAERPMEAERQVRAQAQPDEDRRERPGAGRKRRRSWGGGSARADHDAEPEASDEVEPGTPAASADPAAQARALCLRLLTGAPRTRKQLAEAMRKRALPEEVIDEVLSRYEEVGLIDDAAFADAWVESRHRGRGLARRALAMELRSRGVDTTVVAEAVAQLDPEREADTARELVQRKLRSTRGLDRQVRIRRLAGMLARRGYSEGLALRVVREALAAEPNDDE